LHCIPQGVSTGYFTHPSHPFFRASLNAHRCLHIKKQSDTQARLKFALPCVGENLAVEKIYVYIRMVHKQCEIIKNPLVRKAHDTIILQIATASIREFHCRTNVGINITLILLLLR